MYDKPWECDQSLICLWSFSISEPSSLYILAIVNWPLKLAKSGPGVDEASGTVVCTKLGCTVIKSRRSDAKKKKEDKLKKHLKHADRVVNESLVQNENVTIGAFGKEVF